jgi:hypothetical protein
LKFLDHLVVVTMKYGKDYSPELIYVRKVSIAEL